jgi:hypothetical protein
MLISLFRKINQGLCDRLAVCLRNRLCLYICLCISLNFFRLVRLMGSRCCVCAPSLQFFHFLCSPCRIKGNYPLVLARTSCFYCCNDHVLTSTYKPLLCRRSVLTNSVTSLRVTYSWELFFSHLLSESLAIETVLYKNYFHSYLSGYRTRSSTLSK